MSKMIVMKGLPACGKSTAAKALMSEGGNFVRINKDLLRTMLHFDKFNGRNENLTRDAARGLAKFYLSSGTSVIIDDTNLNPRTMESWRTLAGELGAKFEVVDMTEVAVSTCVMRDAERVDSVGGTVIKNMALRSGITTFKPDSVVLCDIDGTISDLEHRKHYVEQTPKDWKGFFGQMHLDPVRNDVRKMLIQYYNEGKAIIFMSARPEDYKEVTLKWLEDNLLSFAYTLIMRRTNDSRPDTEVKKDLLEQHFPDSEVIHVVIDDRPSVIRLWRGMGLNVIDVGKGIEF